MIASAPLPRIDIPTVRHWLDDADAAQEFLQSLGVVDYRRAHTAALVRSGAPDTRPRTQP